MIDRDAALWRAYTKDVVPLGRPAGTMKAPIRRERPLVLGHTLDLHGMTLTEAHAATVELLSMARHRYRHVTIITGRSGAIRQEFLHWVTSHPDIRRVEAINGDGGFRVFFRKRAS